MKKLTFATALGAALTSSALAAPVNFDEATGGDLGTNHPLRVFNLDVGVNRIAGTITYSGNADDDSFAFVLGQGMTLGSVQLDMWGVEGGDVTGAWGFFRGTLSNGTWLGDLIATSPGQDSVTGSFGAGSYRITQAFMTVSGNAVATNTAGYAFTFTVTGDNTGNTVPEPTSLALVGLALAAGALKRRR